jgi:hypothetical protein
MIEFCVFCKYLRHCQIILIDNMIYAIFFRVSITYKWLKKNYSSKISNIISQIIFKLENINDILQKLHFFQFD